MEAHVPIHQPDFSLLFSVSPKKPTLNFLYLITNGLGNLCILYIVIQNRDNKLYRESLPARLKHCCFQSLMDFISNVINREKESPCLILLDGLKLLDFSSFGIIL